MKKSYTFEYVKVYFWQFLSVILSFLSMFIVMPKLTSQPLIYGIYALCISSAIFLGYADLGFIASGIKYASEYYARDDRKKEIQIIGFSTFILFIFLCLYSLIILYLSIYPTVLIKGLNNLEQIQIASQLLLILAIFTPAFVIDKILLMIFSIRIHDYIYRQITIVGNVIKILSVFYFFRSGVYNIVGYYLFFNLINIVSYICGLCVVKYKYNYDFKLFFKSFKFSREVYSNVKSLAYGSLFITIAWVVFNEIDMFVIVKILGGESNAYYGLALTISNVFKIIFGIIYSPYVARINHFIGLKDEESLKEFFLKTIYITLPFVIIPVIVTMFFSKYIIFTLAGDKYITSVNILIFLSLTYIYTFISYTTLNLLLAKEKIKEVVYFFSFMPILYWVLIIIFFKKMNVMIFPISKFITNTYITIFYIYAIKNIFKIKIRAELVKILKYTIIPIILIIFISFYLSSYMPVVKNKINFLIVVFSMGIAVSIGFISYYITCFEFRDYIKSTFNKIIVKFKI
jgi:O-antigen/teichoic acid export membrane protein